MGRRAYKWVLREWLPGRDLSTAARLLETMRLSRTIEPQRLERPSGRRLLVLAPHPDDEAIGPGGTLLRAGAAGSDIRVVYITSGTPGELPDREHEAAEVCRQLGCSHAFLRHDVFAVPLASTAGELRDAIAGFAPDTLFVPFLLDDNDDHRRINEVLLTLADAGDMALQPEVWAYQVYTPLPGNVAVDITDLAHVKADTIRRYRTQMRRRDWAHFALGLNAFNCRLLHDVPDPRYFEIFFVVPWPDYIELCRTYFAGGDTYYETGYRSRANA